MIKTIKTDKNFITNNQIRINLGIEDRFAKGFFPIKIKGFDGKWEKQAKILLTFTPFDTRSVFSMKWPGICSPKGNG